MDYRVKMTDHAIRQMQDAAAYIAIDLMEPETADRWLTRMQEEISGLNFMPGRFAQTEEEPWRTVGIHKMVVGNFLVYFYIDEPEYTVWVTAVVYGGRDQRRVLEGMPLE